MIKVVPYIETLGTRNYKKLINKDFTAEDITNYFSNWNSKSMGNYWKYSNNNITLEIFPTYYQIKTTKETIRLPLPNTLNDFINDMNRLKIDLFWSEWIEEELEPKDFLLQKNIKKYYKKLLSDIDKNHELLNASDDEI